MIRIIAPFGLIFLVACASGIVPVDADSDTPPMDADGDGYSAGDDCNDNDANVHPGAVDVCDGIDNDCDPAVAYDDAGEVVPTSFGEPDLCVDHDGDSWTLGEDCDDNDAFVYPGATETDNGIDDDCDGEIDEGFDTVPVDSDGDGYTEAEGDCDDTDANVHPGALEICGNDVDEDCDGVADDRDGDGNLTSGSHPDCDDTDAAVYYGALETDNGIDDDCDGSIDEGFGTWPTDADGDGYSTATDCDDSDSAINPAASEYNAGLDDEDNDCDGSVDEDWQAVVEVTYPSSGYYQLNAALYTSGASMPAWTESDLESSGTTTSVEFTTSEYRDMSGACGVVLNVSENNPASDWLCVEWSINEDVTINAWVNGTRYNESYAEIWIVDNDSGSCAVVIQTNSSSACDTAAP